MCGRCPMALSFRSPAALGMPCRLCSGGLTQKGLAAWACFVAVPLLLLTLHTPWPPADAVPAGPAEGAGGCAWSDGWAGGQPVGGRGAGHPGGPGPDPQDSHQLHDPPGQGAAPGLIYVVQLRSIFATRHDPIAPTLVQVGLWVAKQNRLGCSQSEAATGEGWEVGLTRLAVTASLHWTR